MGSARLARLLAPVIALDPTGRYRLLVAGLVAVAVAAAHLLGYCSGEACAGGEVLALLLASLGFVRAPEAPADRPAPLPPAPADDIPFALLALAGVALALLAPAASAQPPGPAPAAAVPTPAGRRRRTSWSARRPPPWPPTTRGPTTRPPGSTSTGPAGRATTRPS